MAYQDEDEKWKEGHERALDQARMKVQMLWLFKRNVDLCHCLGLL
jgi:hypothetical protein